MDDIWGAEFPTQKDGWAGALTLPRVLHMRGDTLLQQPVPELQALRTECLQQNGFTVQKGQNPLSGLKGDCLEIRFTFSRSSVVGELRLGLRVDRLTGECTELAYSAAKNAFALKLGSRTKTSPKLHWIPCEAPDDGVDVHIYIDKCSIEVFIDEGALCFTQRIYPSESSVYYNLQANEGLNVSEFKAWRLSNAF